MNIKLRQLAKNEFEKEFFKLIWENYGKCEETQRY